MEQFHPRALRGEPLEPDDDLRSFVAAEANAWRNRRAGLAQAVTSPSGDEQARQPLLPSSQAARIARQLGALLSKAMGRRVTARCSLGAVKEVDFSECARVALSAAGETPVETWALLAVCADAGFLQALVNRLLGGVGERSIPARPLTAIESAVADELLGRLMREAAATFGGQPGPVRCVDGPKAVERLEVAGSLLQVVVTFDGLDLRDEAEDDGVNLHLRIPVAAAGTDAARFEQPPDFRPADPRKWRAMLERQLGACGVALEAVLVEQAVPLVALLAWRPGEVVRFDAPADAPVRLIAAGTPLLVGSAMRAGGMRGVRLGGTAHEAPAD